MDVENDDGRSCYRNKHFDEIHVRQNRLQRHRNRQRRKIMKSWVVFALIVVLVSILSSSTVTTAARSGGISAGTDRNRNDGNHQQQQHQKEQLPPDFFVEDESVILITGAAGFLGSELALALHRTYSPKLIILVDRMQDRPQSQEQVS